MSKKGLEKNKKSCKRRAAAEKKVKGSSKKLPNNKLKQGRNAQCTAQVENVVIHVRFSLPNVPCNIIWM